MIKISGIVLIFLIISIFSNVLTEAQTSGGDVFQKCAEIKIEINPNSHIASDNINIFVPTINDKIISLDKHKLTLNWETDLGGQIVSDVYYQDETILAITQIIKSDSQSGQTTNLDTDKVDILWIIEQKTGLINKKISLPLAEKYYFLASHNHPAILDSNGNLYTLDENFIPTKESATDTEISLKLSPKPFIDKLYLPVESDLYSIVLNGENKFKKLKTSNFIDKFVVLGNDSYIFGDDKGNIILFDSKRNKKKWQFKTGGELNNLKYEKYGILAASVDGFIYLLSINGNLKWKHRIGNRINGDILITDDKIVFGLLGEETIVILSLKNGQILNLVETGDKSNSILVNASDNEQFLTSTSDKLIIFSKQKCS